MKNYKIWKQKDNEEQLLVEVFNDCDVISVQKEFIEDGYKIIQCQKWYSHTFMLVERVIW